MWYPWQLFTNSASHSGEHAVVPDAGDGDGVGSAVVCEFGAVVGLGLGDGVGDGVPLALQVASSSHGCPH